MSNELEMTQYLCSPAAAEALAVRSKDLTLDQAVYRWRSLLDCDDSTPASKPNKPYGQVDLVYICVNLLIDFITGIPLVLSTINEEIIESGPAYDFLFNNPRLSFEQLITQAIGHYALSRDVFFVFPDKAPGQPPAEVFIVSGTQMSPITADRRGGGELVGWEFRGVNGERVQFSLDEVVQWKNFNPYDRHHGLGPAAAGKLNIEYCYSANLFNTASLQNGADPGVILKAPGKVDPSEVQMLRSQFEARHGGAANAKRTALLTGGMDAMTLAMNMVDMQMADILTLTGQRLCKTFGVPPAMAGLVTEAQYSHGPAQRDFVFNTGIPLAALFGSVITNGILSRFPAGGQRSVHLKSARHFRGSIIPKAYYRAAAKAAARQTKLFAWCDVSQHPTVQEYNRETAEKVLKYTDAGIPLNQLIAAHDLPYEEVPWGNDWWIQMGRVPAKLILEEGLEAATGGSLPEGEGEEETDKPEKSLSTAAPMATEKATLVQKLRIWKNWVVSWAGLEREHAAAYRVLFVRQERLLKSKLKAAYGDLAKSADSPDQRLKKAEDIIARVVFDLKKENGKIRVINDLFFQKASELGIRQALTESGVTGEDLAAAVPPVKASSLLKASQAISTERVAAVNQVTQRKIAATLRSGLDQGEPLQQLTDRISDVLGESRARALRIARTQTAGALNTGRHAAMVAAGNDGKGWITSGDDHVRQAHRQAGLDYAAAIPIEQPFIVGGERLMYPGDPSGSAANIVNCRCLQIALALREQKGKSWRYYQNYKFYSYADMQRDLYAA